MSQEKNQIEELEPQFSATSNSVSIIDRDKSIALHLAVKNRHVDSVKILLRENPDLAYIELEGQTALNIAAQTGDAKMVELILTEGPNNKNLIEEYGWSALRTAAQDGYADVVKLILEASPGLVSIKDTGGYTALHLAAAFGHAQVIELLIQRDPNLAKIQDQFGQTALHLAARNDHLEALTILIRKNAELVGIENVNGDTAIHVLAIKRCYEGLKLFFAEFPELLNLQTSHGDTLLHSACNYGNAELVKMLIVADPDLVNKQNTIGIMPIHYASGKGHLEAVKILLEANPEVISKQAYNGSSAIHFACFEGHTEVAQILLEAKPEIIDMQANYGMTALHFACIHGRKESIKMLISHWASHNLETLSNQTALSIAVENGHEDCAILIRAASAFDKFISRPTVDNLTLLSHYGSVEQVTMLISRFNTTCKLMTRDYKESIKSLTKAIITSIAGEEQMANIMKFFPDFANWQKNIFGVGEHKVQTLKYLVAKSIAADGRFDIKTLVETDQITSSLGKFILNPLAVPHISIKFEPPKISDLVPAGSKLNEYAADEPASKKHCLEIDDDHSQISQDVDLATTGEVEDPFDLM